MIIENVYWAALFAFVGACLIDYAFIWYMHYAGELREYSAGLWAMIIGAPSIFGTKNYIQSDFVAFFYLCGLGVGTILAVKYKKWKKNKNT